MRYDELTEIKSFSGVQTEHIFMIYYVMEQLN